MAIPDSVMYRIVTMLISRHGIPTLFLQRHQCLHVSADGSPMVRCPSCNIFLFVTVEQYAASILVEGSLDYSHREKETNSLCIACASSPMQWRPTTSVSSAPAPGSQKGTEHVHGTILHHGVMHRRSPTHILRQVGMFFPKNLRMVLNHLSVTVDYCVMQRCPTEYVNRKDMLKPLMSAGQRSQV